MDTTPFKKIKDAATVTGLSQFFIRRGCKDGTIPHIKSGGVYYVNVALLLKQQGVTTEEQGA